MLTKTMATTLAMASLLASMAWAQNDSQTSTMAAPKPSRMNVYDPVGWFPFIGLTGGYMSADDTLRTEGTPGDLKILGSYFSDTRHSVFDIGLGFMADSFSQKSEAMNNFISGGVAEAAWRYNSTSRWQFGPIVDAFIGGGDRYGSTDSTWTSFAGLQILKEIPVKGSNIFRVGLKGLTDLSIPGATINTVMLDLQWGFGSEQKAPEITENENMTPPPSVDQVSSNTNLMTPTNDTGMVDTTAGATTAAAATAGALSSHRVIETDPDGKTLTLKNDDHMQFATGDSTIETANSDYIKRVGAALAQRPDLFDKVEVIGFADKTGSKTTNMKVSKDRANSVAKIFKQSGLDNSKITVLGKGASQPTYQSLLPEDLAIDRRVDLKFDGVKDQDALQQLLNTVQ